MNSWGRRFADPGAVTPSRPGPGATELFAGTTVDLTFSDAHHEAARFAPDPIVCDPLHYCAQLVAASLGVPWASLEISGGVPPELAAALDARCAPQYEPRGVTPTAPIAKVDPYPAPLHGPGWEAPPNRNAMRPNVYGAGAGAPPALGFEDDRPVVLLTLGTSIFERDGDPLTGLLAAALECDVNVVVTAAPDRLPNDLDGDRVRAVGFVPLAKLLPATDVVLGAGGTGTLLATLSAGLPMVLRPVKADQPANAQRAATLGMAIVIDEEADAAAALSCILADPAFAAAARDVAAAIASLSSPEQVLEQLVCLADR